MTIKLTPALAKPIGLGPIYTRGQQRRDAAIREARLITIIRQGLAEIRSYLTRTDLRAAAAMHRTPAIAGLITARWHQHTERMVEALLAPTRGDEAIARAIDPAFDRLARTAEQLARAQIGRLIQQLSPAQLLAVQMQIAKLIELGPTPQVLAAIGQATGLTAQQTQRVANVYQAALDAGTSAGQAAQQAQGYADRLLEQRARTIARQEAVTYTNQLVLARGRTADAGNGVITKQWVSARDGRVDGGLPTGICARLDNNQRIPIDEPFVFEGEEFDAPPAHIGCRCLLEIWRDDE